MRFTFATAKLRKLYEAETGARRYPPAVVDAFFEVMVIVDAARSEQDLRAMKQLHFEKLKGSRNHQRSLALHGGFRLVVRLESDADGAYVLVESIEDYHRG